MRLSDQKSFIVNLVIWLLYIEMIICSIINGSARFTLTLRQAQGHSEHSRGVSKSRTCGTSRMGEECYLSTIY